MNTENICQVFAYCDQIKHDNMSSCCNSMDRYYGCIVGGVDSFFCARCEYLSQGTLQNSVFYRDHGVHLGEQSRTEKMMGIMRGKDYFYLFLHYYTYIIIAQIKEMKDCLEDLEVANYGAVKRQNLNLNGK